MLYIGLAIQQQTDNLSPSLETGQSQSCVAVGLNLGVDVRAHIQQQLHCWYMAIHGCQHQRRDSQLTASPERRVEKNIKFDQNKIKQLTI